MVSLSEKAREEGVPFLVAFGAVFCVLPVERVYEVVYLCR